jgi:hypothetical protein
MAKSIREIAEQVLRETKKQPANSTDETPVNINTGTLTGGQHVNNVVINGDYIPGNKNGKKGKKA